MIRIGKPYVYEIDDRAYLKAPVHISEDTAKKYIEVSNNHSHCTWLTGVDYPPKEWEKADAGLWFSVPKIYKEFLSDKRSNAFVVALFWFAMVTESDICFDIPMSKKLFEGLTNGIMKEMEKNGHKAIRLMGPLTSESILMKKGVVTGMSCGVDSMYTLRTNNKDENSEGIDYLTFYEASYLFPKFETIEDLDIVYNCESKKTEAIVNSARIIAKHNELPFIHVLTNMDKDYYRGGIIYNAMYRCLACTLILEPMYHKYISSSSGHGKSIKTGLFVPSQLYEDLLCNYCQTESMSYVNSDHVERVDKLRLLADDIDFQKYVFVCYNENNCGECYGCWKTMFPLDIMGKLDNFSESFDLEKYYRTREKQFAAFIEFSKLPESDSARDLLSQMLSLAKKENTESAKLFLKVVEEKK